MKRLLFILIGCMSFVSLAMNDTRVEDSTSSTDTFGYADVSNRPNVPKAVDLEKFDFDFWHINRTK
jgi:hypothetical protein